MQTGSTESQSALTDEGATSGGTVVERSLTIGKSSEELYRTWLDPQTLPQVMAGFAEVTPSAAGRAHWKVEAPLGQTLEWETQMVEEQPGQMLRWESLPEASVPNEGAISFRPAPQDWGTEVKLRFRFDPPGGVLSSAVNKALGDVPSLFAMKALRRFKSLVETGEIPTTSGQPAARNGGRDD